MEQSELSKAFVIVLKRYQKQRKLTNYALAQLAGIHQTYIGLLESGERNPMMDTANKIAKALNVPLSKMLAEAEKLLKEPLKSR